MKKTKIILVLLMTLVFFLNSSMAQVRIHGELKRISFARLEDKLEVQMEVAMPFEYKSFVLSDPNRLVIDLKSVRFRDMRCSLADIQKALNLVSRDFRRFLLFIFRYLNRLPALIN